jgi:HNH endonuclease/AP2 domain
MPEIPLTKGKVAIVDDCDYEEISKRSWYCSANGYACAKKDGVIVLMHREIMSPKNGEHVDHINGNKVDNRRENLRCCTSAENAYNAKTRFDSVSGYKGVNLDKRGKKWRARIHVGGQEYSLGVFDSKHDAARMYNFWAIQFFGEFAKINKIVEEKN